MRQYNMTTQTMLLDHLASSYRDQPTPTRVIELWRVRKGKRELRCVGVYLPNDIDVRLMEGEGFRCTRLFRDAVQCRSLSDDWKEKLAGRGWANDSVPAEPTPTPSRVE